MKMKKWFLLAVVTLGVAVPSVAFAAASAVADGGCPCPICF
jgi:hypothetical protein